tara:strand:+ start:9238 stop:10491 length:1254 start_codon:yes stop_codon:yes gene_type:complete
MNSSIFKVDKVDFLNLVSFKAFNFLIVLILFTSVRNNFGDQDFIDFGYYWNISLMLAGIIFGGISATILRILNVSGGVRSLVDSKILKVFIAMNVLIGVAILSIFFLKPSLEKIYLFLLFAFGLFFQIQTLLITIMRIKKYSLKMHASSIISVIFVLGCFYYLLNIDNDTNQLFLNLVISYMCSLIIIIIFLRGSLYDLYSSSDENSLNLVDFKNSYITYTAINTFSYVYLTIDFYLLRELLSEDQLMVAGSTKIYFDRFIIPFLTIISGLFSLNVYRIKSKSIVGNEKIDINFSFRKEYLLLVPLFIVLIAAVYLFIYAKDPLMSFFQITIISLSYICFNINGVLLDGVALVRRPRILILAVSTMLVLSYLIFYYLIKSLGINGWIAAMCIMNILGVLLFYILAKKKDFPQFENNT